MQFLVRKIAGAGPSVDAVVLLLALRMIAHRKTRLFLTILGIAALFLLSSAQVGMLVGWCNTISAIIHNAEADIWVMAERSPAFDYGSPIPQHRLYQVRNVPGVGWAEGMLVDWGIWQRPDGRRINVALVGLDTGVCRRALAHARRRRRGGPPTRQCDRR